MELKTPETCLIENVTIKRMTEKAILIKASRTGFDAIEVWMPKTVVVNYNKPTKTLQIAKWFADKQNQEFKNFIQ